MSNLVRFAIQLGLFLCFWTCYFAKGQITPNAAILLFPLLVFLLQFGVQLLMYATPVIYPSSQMPDRIGAILKWNRLAPIFETARYGLLGAGNFSVGALVYSAAITIVLLPVERRNYYAAEQITPVINELDTLSRMIVSFAEKLD